MHTKRPQNSTVAGGVTLTGAVMLILGNIEIRDTLSVLSNLKWDQVMPIILILVGGFRALLMKERTRDSTISELRNKK